MAISIGLHVQIVLIGDGIANSVSIDLTKDPYAFLDGSISNDFGLKGGLLNPTGIIPQSLDSSTIDLPAVALAADVAIFTFPQPLPVGPHELDCVVTF